MIAKGAIQAFLSRKLEDLSWLKTANESKLDEILRLEFKGEFHTIPFRHQKVCTLIGISEPLWAYFVDMGGGKTKIILDVLSHHRTVGNIKRTLVLVPQPINTSVWVEQAKLHQPSLRVVSLVGSKAQRVEALKQEADIFVMNYKGLEVFMTAGSRTGKRQIEREGTKEFISRFDSVVYDESHHLGSHRSLVYRMAKRLSARCRYRYALTGTPFGRDPAKLWSQFDLIDGGQTLGNHLNIFRAAFFDEKVNYWGGYEYKFRESMKEELARVIRNKSIRYEAAEMNDLPELVMSVVEVELQEQQKVFYQRVVDKLKEVFGDYRSTESTFHRMRQITAGFVSLKHTDEEQESERIEHMFLPNPKLAAMLEIVETALEQESKIVVFHEYIPSGKLISEELTRAKIRHVSINGSVSGAKAKENLEKFQRGNVPVMVVNSVSGGTGLNLQEGCHYVCFYEAPVSPIIRQQALKRVHRTGQTRTVFAYDIVAKGTVDRKILKYLEQGKNLLKDICDGEATWE